MIDYRILLAVVCALVIGVAFSARAQSPADDNITERPSAAVCLVRYEDPNAGSGLKTCLVPDPTTFLDLSTHSQCLPNSSFGPGVTEHPITVPVGDGNVKVWGIVIRDFPDGSFSISNPSEFWKECEDVPMSPIQLGDHPPLEDSLA